MTMYKVEDTDGFEYVVRVDESEHSASDGLSTYGTIRRAAIEKAELMAGHDLEVRKVVVGTRYPLDEDPLRCKVCHALGQHWWTCTRCADRQRRRS